MDVGPPQLRPGNAVKRCSLHWFCSVWQTAGAADSPRHASLRKVAYSSTSSRIRIVPPPIRGARMASFQRGACRKLASMTLRETAPKLTAEQYEKNFAEIVPPMTPRQAAIE